MKFKNIPFSLFKKMPWKNGMGTTFEVCIYPTESSLTNLDFDYRISLATVLSDNKFSHFEGMERYLTVVKGEGIKFNQSTLRSLEIIHFKGDEDIYSGPIVNLEENLDLGVIYNPRKIQCVMQKLVIESNQELILKNRFNYFFKIEKFKPIDCLFYHKDKIDVAEKIELESGIWICIVLNPHDPNSSSI